MGVLTEFVKSEADHLRAEVRQRKELEGEWLASIERLYVQIRHWITEADGGHGLLSLLDAPVGARHEPRLGAYEVKCLTIALGSSEAVLSPRARFVVATIHPPGQDPRRADGLVEIKDGVTAEYFLFRLRSDGSDDWFIQSVARWNLDETGRKVEPLTRDRFESALLGILK